MFEVPLFLIASVVAVGPNAILWVYGYAYKALLCVHLFWAYELEQD